VFMLQGLWTTGSILNMVGGMGTGFVAALIVGGVMYAGFLRLSMPRLFALTNGFMLLIAAGMSARGANFLAQVGLLPSFGTRIWDTSAILPDQSLAGQFFAALVGYIARPSGIEILFYVATVLVVVAMMSRASRRVVFATRVMAALAVMVVGSVILPSSVQALEVLSPYVTKGEREFEHQGYVSHDRDPEASNSQSYVAAFGYSPFSFWRTEIEAEFEREAGPEQKLRYQSFNSENTFQLAEQGEYWIDPAFFLELDFARKGQPNNITTGFLGATTIGPIAETFNLLIHKDYGTGSTPTGFIYSNQAKYRLVSWFEPGFEVFGDTDGKAKFAEQQFAIGPVLIGKIYTFNGQALKYQLGYLFGATPATADGAVRWKIEYEF